MGVKPSGRQSGRSSPSPANSGGAAGTDERDARSAPPTETEADPSAATFNFLKVIDAFGGGTERRVRKPKYLNRR